MTVLVTGASGVIGAAVLPALRRAAGERRVFTAGRDAGCDVTLDLTAEELTLPDGIHTVLHLAGEKRDEPLMQRVNHDGAARLADAAARAGVRLFVHLSSVGVYGAPKHAGVVDESRPHAPRNAYERSKDAGERAVRERCAAAAVDCIVLQPSNVLAVLPGRSRPLLGLVRVVARGWFRYFGRGTPWVNYVALDDVVDALVAAALGGNASDTCIVNTPATLPSLIGWIAAELRMPAPHSHWPYAVGASAAWLGTGMGRLLGRELPMSRERLLELTNTTRFDGNGLRRLTATAYATGIELAIRTMVRSYRDEGLLR
jgi:nucleoside-diphosphate-sugar epimerase